MKLNKLLKKVDNIVENLDDGYLLKKIEEDEKEKQTFELLFYGINYGVDYGEGESMSALSRRIEMEETEKEINNKIREFINYTYKGSD